VEKNHCALDVQYAHDVRFCKEKKRTPCIFAPAYIVCFDHSERLADARALGRCPSFWEMPKLLLDG
jgi:hypothetical protein